jgi:flagellin
MAQGDLTRIRANIAALNALNSLKSINKDLGVRQLRLATGKRLNSAADDPAGLTLARRLDARSRSLAQALSNIGDAENLLAVAEGGANNIQSLVVQMREKIIQAANDTLGSTERAAIQQQLQEIIAEIDDVTRQTTWNNVVLLTNQAFTFQVGAEGGDTITFNVGGSLTAGALGINNLCVANQASSAAALTSVDVALSSVSTLLQQVGAKMQRLGVKQETVSTAVTNTEAARSRIEDADMAREQLESTKLQILQQTATAMLAQANVAPQAILGLFRQ